MLAPDADLVARDQDQTPRIQRRVIFRRRVDVMIADHQEIVAARGVIIDHRLARSLPVAVVGVGVEIAAVPLAAGERGVWMTQFHVCVFQVRCFSGGVPTRHP